MSAIGPPCVPRIVGFPRKPHLLSRLAPGREEGHGAQSGVGVASRKVLRTGIARAMLVKIGLGQNFTGGAFSEPSLAVNSAIGLDER